MDPASFGIELILLCGSEGNKFAEVKGLLETLNEDQRRDVVRYEDEVSES